VPAKTKENLMRLISCAPIVFALSLPTIGDAQTPLAIPEPLEIEHRALHAKLAAALNAGGKTADTAHQLEEQLHPHFLKEERLALPPLGALTALAKDKPGPEMRSVMQTAQRFTMEWPQMLQEHAKIMKAATALRQAAQQEGKPEYVQFVDDLMQHARMEEAVTYPTTALIADYLKLQMR
jgi:iron-sulfur cluster repair protein YtfE (RIC family)